MKRTRRCVERIQSRQLPKSFVGQAIAYILGQRQGLEDFMNAGWSEIDNNIVENAIRPTAAGKKNWLLVPEPGSAAR